MVSPPHCPLSSVVCFELRIWWSRTSLRQRLSVSSPEPPVHSTEHWLLLEYPINKKQLTVTTDLLHVTEIHAVHTGEMKMKAASLKTAASANSTHNFAGLESQQRRVYAFVSSLNSTIYFCSFASITSLSSIYAVLMKRKTRITYRSALLDLLQLSAMTLFPNDFHLQSFHTCSADHFVLLVSWNTTVLLHQRKQKRICKQ